MSKFVPQSPAVCENTVKKFVNLLGYVDKLLVISGAGISTESGIPDYRSDGVGLYAKRNHKPIMHQEFLNSENVRKRFWARNFLAWPNFGSAKCNVNHYHVAKWEQSERFVWLITQNVDGLHIKAGSDMITELHGSGNVVKCMSCDFKESRQSFQNRLNELNPRFMQQYTNPGELAPDCDIMLEPGSEKDFSVPSCPKCNGIFKTEVVFFGDTVPRNLVDHCYEKVDESNGVLVLGSSLSLMSAYRFVYQAYLQEKPVFIINIGPTRADSFAEMKISYRISDVIKLI